MDKQKFELLINKFNEGTCTDAELQLLFSWFNDYAAQADRPQVEQTELKELEEKILGRLNLQQPRTRSYRLYIGIAAAAAALLIIGATMLFRYTRIPERFTSPVAMVTDLPPGGNKAYISFSSGKKMALNAIQTGQQIEQNITKSDEGTLTFNEKAVGNEIIMSTVTTPKGGKYHLILSDGTEVWLNAASSVSLPTSFMNTRSRLVRLSGEAYFEVAKDPKRPFIVETQTQRVQVLGTHFSVNAYTDEPAAKTTLLEGAVRVISTNGVSQTTLVPGQQAIFQNNKISVVKANDEAIAWIDGKMKFSDASLQTIMRQVSRWYNVEIRYEAEIQPQEFTATIPMNLNLKEVLRFLSGIGINAQLEGTPGSAQLVIKN